MEQVMSIAQANIAKARLIYNKNKETYCIIVAFNVFELDSKNNWKFPVRNKCDFVSGDISYETLEDDVRRITAYAKDLLRTDEIEFV
jgi:hypothetical protein